MRGALTAFLVAAAVLATGCTARRTISPGHYHQQPGPNVLVMFTSRAFHFLSNDSVAYVYSSDDVGSSRYGKAKYQLSGNKMMLRFDGTAPPPSTARATTKAPSGDSLNLTFQVKVARTDEEQKPLPGVNVVVQDAAGKTITGTATAGDGSARLQLTRDPQPHRVVFSSIGWQTVEHPLQDGDASLDVLLHADPGEVYPAGKEITFGIASIGDDRLVLKRGKDRTVFVKK